MHHTVLRDVVEYPSFVTLMTSYQLSYPCVRHVIDSIVCFINILIAIDLYVLK